MSQSYEGMNFNKLWVMLKQLKRGVSPEEQMLIDAIAFIEPYARKIRNDIQPTKKDRVLEILHRLKMMTHGWKNREELQEAIEIIRSEME